MLRFVIGALLLSTSVLAAVQPNRDAGQFPPKKNVPRTTDTRVSIFQGLFQFSSPGTFGLVKSWDFLVLGPSGSLGPGTKGPRT